MRILLLLLAISLSSPGFAAESSRSTSIQDYNALTAMTRDLNSTDSSTRYKAARRFFFGVKGLKEQNPQGLNQGDEQYVDLHDLVETLHATALCDHDSVRVYAIKGLRQVIALKLFPDPADERLVLSIWLDILRIANDPNEPKPVRQAASGSL